MIKKMDTPVFRIALLCVLSLITVAVALFSVTSVWPAIGASSVDTLRGILGDRAVAQVETVVFQTEDDMRGWEYNLGIIKPSSPWKVARPPRIRQQPVQISHAITATSTPAHPRVRTPRTLSPMHVSALLPVVAVRTSKSVETPSLPMVVPTFILMPRPLPTPAAPPAWSLRPIKTMDNHQSGEGQWAVYLREPIGRVIAYRAFLHPDPRRPYATAGIIAFDLKAIRLHFVLGTKEPFSRVKIQRPGRIPPQDFRCGRLIAVFNGGFKARHGHFGVMVHGVTVLPPRQGLGTVAIYKNGHVRIGMWGTEIKSTPDISVWRQNGPLVIHNGKINPHTADYAPKDWGITVKGAIAVSRSALGISKDGRTLYYVAGDYLTLPVLARTLSAVGAYQAMQLDINKYWVHFDAIGCNNGLLRTAPLFRAMKYQNDGRYLKRFWRDFFYVTPANKNGRPTGSQTVADKLRQ